MEKSAQDYPLSLAESAMKYKQKPVNLDIRII